MIDFIWLVIGLVFFLLEVVFVFLECMYFDYCLFMDFVVMGLFVVGFLCLFVCFCVLYSDMECDVADFVDELGSNCENED